MSKEAFKKLQIINAQWGENPATDIVIFGDKGVKMNAGEVREVCKSYEELVRRSLDVLEGLEGKKLPGAMPTRIEKLRKALEAAGFVA